VFSRLIFPRCITWRADALVFASVVFLSTSGSQSCGRYVLRVD
jgi:hypothetical protein